MPQFLQVRHIVDRVFGEYLNPTAEQPTRLILTGAIDADSEDLTYDDSMIVPEELELLSPGTVIEIGSEQILVGGVNEEDNELSELVRGANGTIAESHDVGNIILISPTWPRKTVVDSVGDAIIDLWPRLYLIRSESGIPLSNHIAEVPPDTENIIAVYDSRNNYQTTDYVFRQYDPSSSTDKSAIVLSTTGPIDIRYKTRPIRPTHENQTLDEVNIRDEWVSIIVLGAMLNLLARPDIERMLTNFLVDRMKADSVRVGTGQGLREGLVQLYEYRMSKLINARDREEEDTTSIQQWYAI